jgi:hypothetical protein
VTHHIHFAHISPTAYLEKFLDAPVVTGSYNQGVTLKAKAFMVLAHLVETDEKYVEYYSRRAGKYIDRSTFIADPKPVGPRIMDNSAFEMYKQGRPMMSPEVIIPLANKVFPTHVVMTDYPGEESSKTFKMALEQAEMFHKAGYKTMYVPQSTVGDVGDYIEGWKKGVLNPYFCDIIGLSILGAPNAFGVERGNKLQRFLSRWHILKELDQSGLLEEGYKRRGNQPFIHMLGMVDGPNEIDLVSQYHKYILSWDSSAAVWAGLHNVRFDHSPTGLIDGKFEKEVEFDYNQRLTTEQLTDVAWNMRTIDSKC